MRERVYEADIALGLERIVRHARQALLQLRRSPGLQL